MLKIHRRSLWVRVCRPVSCTIRPADGDAVANFRLNSLRFYVNGQASDNISFMVNTDINYGGTLFVCPEGGACGAGFGNQGNEVQILDAVAQIGISDKFNIWFGRHLPPSDRANLYGPLLFPSLGCL